MSRRAFALFAVLSLALSACGSRNKPTSEARIRKAVQVYPPERDLQIRVLPTSAGAAIWITSGDDGIDKNRRFEKRHILIDPGTGADVVALTRALKDGGLAPGERLDVVVPVAGAKDREPGIRSVTKVWRVRHLADSPSKKYGKTLPGRLNIGGEISAKVLPGGLSLRLIDMTFLFLPANRDPGAAVEANVVIAPNGAPAGLLEKLHPEIWIGPAEAKERSHVEEHGEMVVLDASQPLAIRTDGSEAVFPGPSYRTRHGTFIECAGDCAVRVTASVQGALLVPLEIPRGKKGWFLLDTRSMHSFLTEDRLRALGLDADPEHAGHSHGGPSGVPLPSVTVGNVTLRRWHVRSIPAVDLGGHQLAGVIGRDLLEAFKVRLEPASGELSLEMNLTQRPRLRLPPPATADTTYTVPIDWSPAGPLILAKLDDRRRSLVVSTGSVRSLVSVDAPDGGHVETLTGPLLTFDGARNGVWEADPLRVTALEVAALDLNGILFESQRMWIPERVSQTDILGMDFLRGFREVTFDFRQRSLTLVGK